jgi:CBS domain-containing protein
MQPKPVTVGPDDTIEVAATKLHEHDVSRLPVVGELGLVGIISRVDVLREIIRDDEAPAPDA